MSKGGPAKLASKRNPQLPAATDLTTRHAEARERLLAQYAAIPPGDPVRLAKHTSNLFRPRAATDALGNSCVATFVRG